MGKNRNTFFTIRNSLFGVVAALAILLVILAVTKALDAMADRDDARNVVDSIEISGLLLTAAGQWAVERGVTNTSLSAREAASGSVRSEMERRRKAADEAYMAGLERLKNGRGFKGKSALISEVESNHGALVEMRRRADGALAGSRETRDADVVGNWVPTVTRMIMSSQRLRVLSEFQPKMTDTRIQAQQMLKNLVWTMNEFAGRERAVIGGAVAAGDPLDTDTLRTLSTYRGRLEDAWRNVRLYAERADADLAIVAEIDTVRRDFFADYERTREAVYAAGIAGEAYPLSSQEWIATATGAIDTILNLARVTGKCSKLLAERSAADSQAAILFDLGILAFGIVLALVSFWIVLGRVTRPMACMTQAMAALAAGDSSIEVPSADRTDETGEMARALQVFKENMIERDRLVMERERERERTEQRLRQIAASRTKFFAAASHDLRQPLHALALRLPELEDEADGAPSSEAVKAIRNSCDTMGALLNTLLDISKLDAGEVAPKLDRVPIADIFEHLATEFAPQTAAKSLELRVAPTSAWGVSDAFLLLRILRNFLTNAVRYTPQGKVLLGVRRCAGWLRIEVWDTGIGIAADWLPHVFEEFYQGAVPGSGRDRSLGLGLAIADRLASLMDHRVDVRSWPGKGTVFSIELPMAEQPPERIMHVETPAWTRDLAGLCIVLVEDDAAVLRATESLFKRWGCSVIAADTVGGAVARVAAADLVPDIILADLQLRQDETGMQAIEAIRGASDSPVPAIIITANLDPDRLDEVAARGYPIIRKPLGAEPLRAAVEAVLPTIGNAAPANGHGEKRN